MSQSVLKLDDNILDKVKSHIPDNTSPFSQGEDEEQYRFISFVCEYLRNRNSLDLMPSSGVSYFVFVPPEFIRGVESLGDGVASLRKNKGYELPGNLFLNLDSSLNRTRAIKFSGDDDSVRNQLEEKLQELQECCGKNLLHAVVDHTNKTISAYISDQGAHVDNEYEILIKYEKDVERFSEERLNVFSNEFHEQETKFPNCGMMIWKNQSKYELTDKAEDRIARRFAFTLSTVLGKDNVSQETRGSHGRADIIIHTSGMIEGQGPCVMEFKVLRNRDSAQYCIEWLESGILQVLDYGKDREAKSHYLMVYDGRKELGKVTSIEERSSEKNITYLHFEMYSSVNGERKKILSEIANRDE